MIRHPGNRQFSVSLRRLRSALANTIRDFDRNDYLTQAAALAFFFLLSIFPLFIFLASLFAYVPIPNLFDQILEILAVAVPKNAMGVVTGVLQDVLQTNSELLSIGIAGAIFAASSGFTAMINVLNLAYDVREGRPYWKKRLVAIGLTLLTGIAAGVALVAIALGPQFGTWLASRAHVEWVFAAAWPSIRGSPSRCSPSFQSSSFTLSPPT